MENVVLPTPFSLRRRQYAVILSIEPFANHGATDVGAHKGLVEVYFAGGNRVRVWTGLRVGPEPSPPWRGRGGEHDPRPDGGPPGAAARSQARRGPGRRVRRRGRACQARGGIHQLRAPRARPGAAGPARVRGLLP